MHCGEHGWQSIVHPDDRSQIFLAKWNAALAAAEPVEIEARVWTAQRDYRWLLVRNVPLRDGQGEINQVVRHRDRYRRS